MLLFAAIVLLFPVDGVISSNFPSIPYPVMQTVRQHGGNSYTEEKILRDVRIQLQGGRSPPDYSLWTTIE